MSHFTEIPRSPPPPYSAEPTSLPAQRSTGAGNPATSKLVQAATKSQKVRAPARKKDEAKISNGGDKGLASMERSDFVANEIFHREPTVTFKKSGFEQDVSSRRLTKFSFPDGVFVLKRHETAAVMCNLSECLYEDLGKDLKVAIHFAHHKTLDLVQIKFFNQTDFDLFKRIFESAMRGETVDAGHVLLQGPAGGSGGVGGENPDGVKTVCPSCPVLLEYIKYLKMKLGESQGEVDILRDENCALRVRLNGEDDHDEKEEDRVNVDDSHTQQSEEKREKIALTDTHKGVMDEASSIVTALDELEAMFASSCDVNTEAGQNEMHLVSGVIDRARALLQLAEHPVPDQTAAAIFAELFTTIRFEVQELHNLYARLYNPAVWSPSEKRRARDALDGLSYVASYLRALYETTFDKLSQGQVE